MGFLKSPTVWVVVAAMVIAGYVKIRNNNAKKSSIVWHEGPEWEHFFEVYDATVEEQLGSKRSYCTSKVIESTSKRFGKTQIHTCGNPHHPPVVLFHGMGSTSSIYADWLMGPLVRQSKYVIAIDTLCDITRSCPRDGDPNNCPASPEDYADWFVEILRHEQLIGSIDDNDNVVKPAASLIGYSFGSHIAALLASPSSSASQYIDQLVLIAPAGVFADVSVGFGLRGLGYYVIYPIVSKFPFLRHALRNWFFGSMVADPNVNQTAIFDPHFHMIRDATDDIGYYAVIPPALNPHEYDTATLTAMIEHHPTLLILGEQETVLNVTYAVEKARSVGAQVKVYPNAGHMLLIEHPRNDVINVITSFLSSGSEMVDEENKDQEDAADIAIEEEEEEDS